MEDKRFELIEEAVLKSLKLKQDHWQRCVSSEDNKQVLQEFLDKAEQETLVVFQNSTGLQTAADFSKHSKNRAVYFVKRSKTSRTTGSMKTNLFFGDMPQIPFDHFSCLFEQVSSRAAQQNTRIHLVTICFGFVQCNVKS